MSERSPLISAMKGRRNPSARHSMYVLRQDGPELSFTDAVKNHDALLTSIYGSRSVDQHLTTATTTKADVSALGNAGRPRSTVTFPPVTKSTTSNVWLPLFQHTTLVGSAAPLLATFKRDTHVQTEDEIRSDVGVQTEEAEIRPTTTYKRDVLVQTGDVWADVVSGGGDVSTTKPSEITTNSASDACMTVFSTCIYPEGSLSVKQNDEDSVNQRQNFEPLVREVVEGALQSPTIKVSTRNYVDFNEKNIKSPNCSFKSDQEILQNSSYIFIKDNRPQICSAVSEKDYVSCVPVCKSEISFVPQRPECVAEGGITVASDGFQNVDFPPLESDEPQECPAKFFTTYELITLKGHEAPVFRPESSPKLPVPSSHHTVVSRTLTPDKSSRNSLNMDDYKYDRLSSCNTSERGSMISVLDALYADSFKFESCENLDQLEEEIIRSLCTPVTELEENSRTVIEENSVPNCVEHVEGVPCSPKYFNNMSDQQKTEWHPDGKVTPQQMYCDLQSNDVMRSPSNPVRASTPSKIDKRGMEARGEIIEKLMKGETVNSQILNNTDLNSVEKALSSLPAEGNEITVELLPTQLIASTPILEVRRSSWSATNDPEHAQKANANLSRSQYNSSRNSPVKQNLDENESKVPYLHSSLAIYKQGLDNTGNSPKAENVSAVNPFTVNRSTYWPLQTSNESEPVAKNEMLLNLTQLNDPSTRCDIWTPSETNTIEKVKSAPPTPPPVVPPSPPPPPPPPPPPQCYQPSKISEITVDNNAKVNDNNSSYPPHSKNSSPGFSTSSPKDLMMQELAERFQKRQKDAVNSQEKINREGNYLPSRYNKENANVSPSLHPHAQKESSPGSNAANPSFKSVWLSTNGEDYIDHNGKDASHSPADKNGIHYNSHSPQEAIPGADQMGNHTSSFPYGGQYSETHRYPNKDDTKYQSPFSRTTILTDEPPPAGAVLVEQKVTVEGDNVHTDKYYAVPVKEVLKEKTSTAKFTPAPPKYDGIGPTDDGVPTGLRQSVKKENMSNWYKTMFKSLHKAGHPHYGGYNSDPEFEREEKAIITKCATLDTRQKPNDSSRQPTGRLQHGYPPSAKSTVEVYNNVFPRPIEDYEPGYSSVVDNEDITLSKRFLPSLNHPKPSYEFKSGYESDTSIIKKLHQPEGPHPEQQKMWYREIQRGGDIPQYGLGKVAPEKPKVPVIGPAPTPSLQSSPVKPTYPQAVRPRTPPPEPVTNDSSVTDVSNGNYTAQMQHAIHAELQRRMSPASQQSPAVYRASPKSPSKSPELKMFARVLYDFISESPRELNLKKDEMVLVLRQLDKNWYEGEHKGAIGIFPVSYVEILPPEHVSPQMKQPLEGLAKAVYDFRAQTSVELPLKKGDTVTLLRRVDQNWYEGRIHDRKGIFPATYVQVVQEPGESRRSSLSPTSRAPDSPHSLKAQEDSVKKSPVVGPTPPPTTYSSSHTGAISNSPSASGRGKKGSSLVEPVLYRALYGYNPQNADELELSEGDNVYVVEMCDDGWFVGTSVRTGVFGIFPGNYVEKV